MSINERNDLSTPSLTMVSVVNGQDGSLTTYTVSENISEIVRTVSNASSVDEIVKYFLGNKELKTIVTTSVLNTVDEECEDLCSLSSPSILLVTKRLRELQPKLILKHRDQTKMSTIIRDDIRSGMPQKVRTKKSL